MRIKLKNGMSIMSVMLMVLGGLNGLFAGGDKAYSASVGPEWQHVGSPGFSANGVFNTSLSVDNGTPYVSNEA